MIGRLLGIDPGRKRIGIAISDALGLGARELAILASKGEAADFAAIGALAREHGAVGIVVGVPLNPNAPPGVRAQADSVLEWIARLRQAVPVPVAEVSEYLTSVEARELAKRVNRGPRQPIDDLAARVILQSYLDGQSCGSPTFPPPEASE